MSKTLGSVVLAFAFLHPAVLAQEGPLESGSEPVPVTGPLESGSEPEPAPAPTPVVTPDKLGRQIRQLERHERCVQVRELVKKYRERLRAEQKERMEALRRRLAEKKELAEKRRAAKKKESVAKKPLVTQKRPVAKKRWFQKQR